jgi:hypothetical protein
MVAHRSDANARKLTLQGDGRLLDTYPRRGKVKKLRTQ